MQPTNLRTIGEHLPALADASSTGQPHGETGSANLPIAAASAANAWLLEQATVRAADEALSRSLTSTCGVTVRARTKFLFPPGEPCRQVADGCSVFDLAHPDRPAAIRKVEAAMTPATAEQAEGWLVMLQAGVARRNDSEAMGVAAFNLYSAALRQFPADVAKAACFELVRGTPGKTTWWPTLSEVLGVCERLAAPRRQLLAALQAPPADPERQRRTPQEREAVKALLAGYMAAKPVKREPFAPPSGAFPPTPTDAGGLSAVMRQRLADTGGRP